MSLVSSSALILMGTASMPAVSRREDVGTRVLSTAVCGHGLEKGSVFRSGGPWSPEQSWARMWESRWEEGQRGAPAGGTTAGGLSAQLARSRERAARHGDHRLREMPGADMDYPHRRSAGVRCLSILEPSGARREPPWGLSATQRVEETAYGTAAVPMDNTPTSCG